MPTRSWPSVVLALLVVAAACSTADRGAPPSAPAGTISADAAPAGTTSTVVTTALRSTFPPSTSALPPSTTAEATPSSAETTASSAAAVAPEPVVLRLRLDRRVSDAATEGFAPFVEAVLTDERGWQRAGFRFEFSDTAYDYTVVLAEGSEVDELCLPYDTFGRFSCQIGPVVALNADRWRTAVDSWPASLDDYRTMLVNHEVGHLTGQHHPAVRCPGDGQPAPVMAQQSSGVDPCTANPWPLPWEIDCAARRLEPIAPPYERDIQLTCGPDGPVG
ncbi:MAG: DUF3152 domain-containing protein [Actinomycetota bacterium]